MDMHEVTVDAIGEALEESGETLSDKAIHNVASWVDGNYENRELLSGPVESPLVHEMSELKARHKREVEHQESEEIKRSKESDERARRLVRRIHILEDELERSAA